MKEAQGILEHILDKIMNETEDKKVKIPIATVSKELNEKYNQWREREDEIEEQIKAKMQLLKSKLEREVAEEFEEIFINHRLEKKRIWREIRKEINLTDEDVELNIDPKTGVISEWVTTNEPRN